MNLQAGTNLHGFRVQESRPLIEIDGTAYVMLHEKSGARLLYLQNDDNDKAFSISFKTPPDDDTGVFHILEHSVLCGSRKFPVKEPFVNLLKSSMQTFLNAMTFPDKTMYPVASTNEQDLLNLMDVYLDAVLHPAIYTKPTIFEQEGWHYETASDENGEKSLSINGVVYNEMKGALSDPSSVLYDNLQQALFPDNAYRFESGGTPQAIPDLTYEQFLANHAQHYRLDNSYITLYGNLNIDRMLAFLDESYLSPVADEERARASLNPDAPAPRTIELQSPVVAEHVTVDMDTAPENACMGIGCVVGRASDRTRAIGVDILLDAIMGSNEAPLKRALLDADIADDAQAFLADALLQPFAVVQLRGTKEGAADKFREIFDATLRELADGGLDRSLVEASLSHAEFVMRESDFGMSDGVALSMAALSGWLYDDSRATDYLRYEEDFRTLREGIETGLFEKLIREVFLENNHWAFVELRPCDDLPDYEAQRIAEVRNELDADAFESIETDVEALRAAQEQPDSPEALATLPQLSLSDLAEAPSEPNVALQTCASREVLRHDIRTRGIVYACRYFDLTRVDFEELPYVSLLNTMLGKLDTKQRSAAELDTAVNGRLGTMSFFVELFEDAESDAFEPKLVVATSALEENVRYLASLPHETMTETLFDDTEKIRDVLQQRRSGLERRFANAGHSCAMMRLGSYYHPASVVREKLGGVEYYRFVKDLLEHFDDRAEETAKKLKELAERLFTDDYQLLSFTGSDDALEQYLLTQRPFGTNDAKPGRLVSPRPEIKNEAFVVPTDVTYTACGYNQNLVGGTYDGAWQVAARALSFDHLWNEVRVKGGAYGAGFQAGRTGTVRFYSYRDPRIDETVERFAHSAEWLESFDAPKSELDGYVLATVAAFDRPLKAAALMKRQDNDWLSKRTREDRLETRAQIISVTKDRLRSFGPIVRRVLDKGARCTFGNREIIESSNVGLAAVDLLNEC